MDASNENFIGVPACPECDYVVSDSLAQTMSHTGNSHTCGRCGTKFTMIREVYYQAKRVKEVANG